MSLNQIGYADRWQELVDLGSSYINNDGLSVEEAIEAVDKFAILSPSEQHDLYKYLEYTYVFHD